MKSLKITIRNENIDGVLAKFSKIQAHFGWQTENLKTAGKHDPKILK